MVDLKNFNAIVFTGQLSKGNKGFVKYKKINDFKNFLSFIHIQYPLWKFMTIYDRITNNKEIIKND